MRARALKKPSQQTLGELSIERGENDLLFAADGREYIDLFTGCGTVFLGHLNPAVRESIQLQLDKLWNTGAVPTPARQQAYQLVETFLPPGYRLAAMYSTGMEAMEFALRVARVSTDRKGVVGFDGSMHGKSMAAAFLGWSNDLVDLPDFHRIPYVSSHSPDAVLNLLEQVLADRSIAAVFVEPLQGSSGGYISSAEFLRGVAELCSLYGTLLVTDEIFTGFHRTGRAFLVETLGVAPDILLIGKAMGNGFPVSGVVVDKRLTIEPAMLPGSTYAGNPLAAAAVLGTLSEMKTLNMRDKVSCIEKTILDVLKPLQDAGVPLRGAGALWVLELPSGLADQTAVEIIHKGVVVAPAGPYIRLLPPATISPEHLFQACDIISEVVLGIAS